MATAQDFDAPDSLRQPHEQQPGEQQPGEQQPGEQQPHERQPWEQQPGEPDRWFGRFTVYLQLGPLRSYRQMYREIMRLQNRESSSWLSGRWLSHVHRWRWRERAQAWDTHQRNLLALSERNVRLALHHRRVNVMEDTLEEVRAALATADIGGADQEQAREWIPQLRVFLRDMLVAERQEFERLDFSKDDSDNGLVITADDLRAAQREMEAEAAQAAHGVEAGGATPTPSPVAPLPSAGEKSRKDITFLVCTGPDSALLLDLAVLRAVRAATGLQFVRLLNATRPRLAKTLSRQRCFGHPIKHLHMAVHASAAGLELADGPVDGNWLSERLEGVQVLLLASCESDRIGEWLGVVPYVITLSEDIPNEDAATLAQHFWHGIGLGKEPDEALDAALAQCPPAVAEYVVRHW